MSIRTAARRIEKIAELESVLVIDARIQRASKIRGELKRRSAADKKTGGVTKKRKANFLVNTTRFKLFDEFFKSFKLSRSTSVKSQFFHFLSKNHIIDTTDFSQHSQMNILPEALKAVINSSSQNAYQSGRTDDAISKILKKEDTSLRLKLKSIIMINTR